MTTVMFATDVGLSIPLRILPAIGGFPVTVALAAAPDVEATAAGEKVEWRCRGERPCFASPSPVVPGGLGAGWYELQGELTADFNRRHGNGAASVGGL